MTRDEKIDLCVGGGPMEFRGVPRLNLPKLVLSGMNVITRVLPVLICGPLTPVCPAGAMSHPLEESNVVSQPSHSRWQKTGWTTALSPATRRG